MPKFSVPFGRWSAMRKQSGKTPLDRATYRRRRLEDAARLLPFLGALLFLAPLLWAGNPEATTGNTWIFLIGSWLVLIGMNFWLSHVLRRRHGADLDL